VGIAVGLGDPAVARRIDAGTDWASGLAAPLPQGWQRSGAVATSFDIWITPPEYTGLAPQFLRAGATETGAGSDQQRLLAQVHGGGSVPRLAIDRETREFEAVDKHNFRSQTTLSAGKTPGKTLSVTQGGTTLGQWSIAIPDNPPEIAFTQPPKPTQRAALRLDFGPATITASRRSRRSSGGRRSSR
jgi:hypothetical protein